MRVFVATLLPDGGLTAVALRRLGYNVVTATSVLRNRTLRTQWQRFLREARRESGSEGGPLLFPPRFLPSSALETYVITMEVAAGSPAALVPQSVIDAAPIYTKVILVEIPNKEEVCAAMDNMRQQQEMELPRIIRDDVLCLIPGGKGCPIPTLTPPILEAYDAHVRTLVPPDRLLVFRPHAGDSWKQLCAFLEIEQTVPDTEPFPKLVGDFDGGCFEFRLRTRKAIRKLQGIRFLAFVVVTMLILRLVAQQRPREVQ